MTTQNDIIGNKDYTPVLDHGFIGIASEELANGELVPGVLGNDASISRAARMSYGKGTRAINDDRNLLRYLLRHKHTTPFEMVEFKFHMKMPIFVARQFIRHRTANVNEYSARYSIMPEEFYIPKDENVQPQSSDNKQGRSGKLSQQDIDTVKWVMDTVGEMTYELYTGLITPAKDVSDEVKNHGTYMLYDGDMYTEDFPGIARESARAVLPINVYTEWYWKCDLHNIFHFMKLRMDPHAQYEIRVYAQAMYQLVKQYVPLACEAFEDYILNGVSFSHMEMNVIRAALPNLAQELEGNEEKQRELMQKYGLSKREVVEFINKVKR